MTVCKGLRTSTFANPSRLRASTIDGPVDISSNNLARMAPLRNLRSLPHTCHQKFSNRCAVGSISFLKVVV